MTLTNDTTLRGYLAHMKANIRKLYLLHGEAIAHPASTPERNAVRTENSLIPAMREEWEKIRRDVWKILEVQLVPFGEVASAPFVTGTRDIGDFGPDPLRITFRVLKARADKARRKDPTIVLLKSWDLVAREPTEEE